MAKILTAFRIDKEVLEKAHQKCREIAATKGERITFSNQMEKLVISWLKKGSSKTV